MKIGIVTFTTGDNFGQRLQNFALQNVLESFGASVCTLRRKDFRLENRYWFKVVLKSFFNKAEAQFFRRHKCFVDFDNRFIKYYQYLIDSKKIDKDLRFAFDKFIVGSDQVWSPLSGDVDDFYFLTFAKDEQKFCYAPSFSVDSIPEDKQEYYKKNLSSFRKLNCREYAGRNLIEQMGISAEVVVDPTLLISKEVWTKMEQKPIWLEENQKYVLKYFLGEQMDDNAPLFSGEDGCIIINILDKMSTFYPIGPAEFLYLINHAEAVLTDSYHGTIFSVIMGTPFKYCVRKDGLNDMSSRFATLFTWLNIEGHNAGEIIDPKTIDMSRINNLREYSLEVLKDIILE